MYDLRVVVIAEVLATLLISGCGLNSSTTLAPQTLEVPPTVFVFDANGGPWLPNTGRWYSYQQSDLGCETGVGFPDGPLSPASCFVWLTDIFGAKNNWVSSQGPWWVDPNHQYLDQGTGFGFVHVVAFVQLPAAIKGTLNLNGTTVRLRTRISSGWSRPIATSREGEKPSRSYLWFQTSPRKVTNCSPNAQIGENCTRQSNYIFTDNWRADSALDQSSNEEGQAFEIKLNGLDASKWTCLGAGRNVKYDCLPFDQAIEQVSLMGVLQAPVLPCPISAPAGPGVTCDRTVLSNSTASFFNSGRFDLRDFTISIDETFSRLAHLIDFGYELDLKPATKWRPLRFAFTSPLKQGEAIHFVIPKDSKALKFGLTFNVYGHTFETAGPHLYISPANREPGQAEPSLYIGAADDSGAITRTLSVSRYKDGDRVSIYLWNDKLVFAKNGQAVHMTSSPCLQHGKNCALVPFYSTDLENLKTPLFYKQ
jgi:hypothetical protein